MSTRTIIRFKQGKDIVDVYQHGDGYPSWTIPELERFLKWNGIRNNDLSYSVANFVTFGKLESFIHQVEWAKEDEKNNSVSKRDKEQYLEENMRKLIFEKQSSNFSMLHTGYGILGKLSEKELLDSWMEFHYVVEFPEDFDENVSPLNQEYKIPITVYIPAKDHLKKIGSCIFDTKEGKISKYTGKVLLKEIEN